MSTTKAGKGKAGRPSDFNDEICLKICERIAEGKSLRSICVANDMPTISTVFRWLAASESFQERYALAKKVQADVFADEIIDLADTPKKGVKKVTKDGKVETTEADMIEHRRLQIDARKWMISKLAPKKYGDKTQLEHSGPDGGPIQTKDVSDYTDDQRAKALANFLMRTKAKADAAQDDPAPEAPRD